MLLRGGIWPLPCAHLIPTTPHSPNSSTSPCRIGGLLFKNVGIRKRWFKHDRTYGARNSIVKAVCSSIRCPYQILGLDTKASEKEIKRAYRGLALKFHPDVNKEPDAQEKFMQIKQAYQTLIDPKKRAKYDSKRQANETWSGKSRYREEEFYGLEDFFRDLQEEFRASKGRPKSLWEELAELGEEFVEFLEKELNIEPDKDHRVEHEEAKPFEKDKAVGKTTDANVNDIEEMLNQLKKELGI